MKKFSLPKLRWQHLLLSMLGLTFAVNVSAADNNTYSLVLWDHSGAIVGSYELAYSPNVTFADDQVIVTTSVADVYYYALPEMWKFTYTSKISGINNILADNAMKFNGDAIIFPALEAGNSIAVYATNGTLVLNKTVSAAGEYCLPLSSLSQGVYMVNVNGKTYKIVKK